MNHGEPAATIGRSAWAGSASRSEPRSAHDRRHVAATVAGVDDSGVGRLPRPADRPARTRRRPAVCHVRPPARGRTARSPARGPTGPPASGCRPATPPRGDRSGPAALVGTPGSRRPAPGRRPMVRRPRAGPWAHPPLHVEEIGEVAGQREVHGARPWRAVELLELHHQHQGVVQSGAASDQISGRMGSPRVATERTSAPTTSECRRRGTCPETTSRRLLRTWCHRRSSPATRWFRCPRRAGR